MHAALYDWVLDTKQLGDAGFHLLSLSLESRKIVEVEEPNEIEFERKTENGIYLIFT
jgi:hypothetical protein